jgi:hypothetical protein
MLLIFNNILFELFKRSLLALPVKAVLKHKKSLTGVKLTVRLLFLSYYEKNKSRRLTTCGYNAKTLYALKDTAQVV